MLARSHVTIECRMKIRSWTQWPRIQRDVAAMQSSKDTAEAKVKRLRLIVSRIRYRSSTLGASAADIGGKVVEANRATT